MVSEFFKEINLQNRTIIIISKFSSGNQNFIQSFANHDSVSLSKIAEWEITSFAAHNAEIGLIFTHLSSWFTLGYYLFRQAGTLYIFLRK